MSNQRRPARVRLRGAVLALLIAAAGIATAVSAPASAQTPEWIDLGSDGDDDEFSSDPMLLNKPRTFRVSLLKQPGGPACVKITTQHKRYWISSGNEPSRGTAQDIDGRQVGPFPGQRPVYVMQIDPSEWALGHPVKIVGSPGKVHGTVSLKPDTQVANVAVSAVDGASATVTWDAVPHATSYQVTYQGQGQSADSYVYGMSGPVTGLSWAFRHDASESMTLGVTVTPAHRDGNGHRRILHELGASAFLDVVVADDEESQGSTDTGTDSGSPPPSDPPPADPEPDHSALIAQMREWRDDPKWRRFKAHTDRWDRALLAFGETVADSTLTAMTPSEARGYADRGWTRWNDIADALGG